METQPTLRLQLENVAKDAISKPFVLAAKKRLAWLLPAGQIASLDSTLKEIDHEAYLTG